jgi:uncharacterized membrane protein
MPFIGLPWGMVGMLAFALFLWLIISVAKEPTESWVLTHLKIGRNLGILGIGMIFYLIYAEYDIGKLCQYCTTAHVSHVITTFGFFRLSSMYGTKDWGVGTSGLSDSDTKDRKSKRGGYVAPVTASEEE